MRTIGAIWFGTVALFAAGETMDGPFAWAANLTGLGAALATLWWLLTRTIPAQQKTFSDTLDKMGDRWEARESKRDEIVKSVADGLNILAKNCAMANLKVGRDNHTLEP